MIAPCESTGIEVILDLAVPMPAYFFRFFYSRSLGLLFLVIRALAVVLIGVHVRIRRERRLVRRRRDAEVEGLSQ